MTLDISVVTARRFILGRSGLWPGRRWRGLRGTEQAMRAMEHLQLDPLMIMARAHDLMLHSRVVDYAQDDWARLTYERRRFFEWGGWLAVRPMDELPYWRVLMRRERTGGHLAAVAREHGDAIAEMRVALRERGEIANRDYAMHERTRVDHYRGRKDSALALHYLWRTGEAMVTRRDRFERVYAPTDAVAPAHLIREATDDEADDFVLRKEIAADGLSRLTGVASVFGTLRRPVTPAELQAWRSARLDDGTLVEVRVESWRRPLLALAEDAATLQTIEAGRRPRGWSPLETTTTDETTFLSPLDPVSARGRARELFDFDYTWEVYTPAAKRRWGYYTLPILWGDRLVARFDGKLERTERRLVVNGLWLEDEGTGQDEAFAEALARGMTRFLGFLGAERLDVTAVPHVGLRRRLTRLP